MIVQFPIREAVITSNAQPDALFSIRNWLRIAIEAQGADITGAGIGVGEADISFDLDGQRYNVSVRPLPLTGKYD